MRLGRMHPSQQTFTDCSSFNFLEFPALSIAMTCVKAKREEKASQTEKAQLSYRSAMMSTEENEE